MGEGAGFEILSFDVDPVRHPTSAMSIKEWRGIDDGEGISDPPLADAIRAVKQEYVAAADASGLTNKTGHYACWARKPD